MKSIKQDLKIGVIVGLGIIVTILHYNVIRSDLDLHILHRELYFIPIILAGFWFGLKAGMAAALIVSAVYAPHLFLYPDAHGQSLTVLSQIAIFVLVGALLGGLVDRQKEQQKKIIAAENLTLLGRAAATVGYEMQDLLNALRRLIRDSEMEASPGKQGAINVELDRIERMMDVLKSYVPPKDIRLASLDLNQVIQTCAQQFTSEAKKAGIDIQVQLCSEGCPMMMDKQGLETVLENLIKNALEVSSTGKVIQVSTRRDSRSCRIIVEDQGPGILSEHLDKIFTPFFTTKANGQGLALAVCKKMVTEWGGKIEVESPHGRGAIFSVTIPREIGTQDMKGKITDASRAAD